MRITRSTISQDDATRYNPDDPLNVMDRLYDPDDGMDYDRLIAESESERMAGAYLSWDEFDWRMRRHLEVIRRWRRAQGWHA